MYQKEMKEGFIQDYLRSRVIQETTLRAIFKKTERFEFALGKDCSMFCKDEALSMFKGFKSKSVYVLLNNNTVLKAYCAWRKHYHEHELEAEYKNITIEDLKPLVYESENKPITRDEVTDIENNLLNFTDQAIIECLFEGIAGPSMKDITGLSVDMVDHKNKRLIFPDGRIFDLTDRLYDLLCKAFEEVDYMCYGKTLRIKRLYGKGRLYKERDNVHAVDSDDMKFRWVYRKVQIVRDYIGMPNITMKLIAASGFVHYLRQGMMETNLDIKSFLQTKNGEMLMDKYNYTSDFRVDNLTHRFASFI